jgi:hypothetical protein
LPRLPAVRHLGLNSQLTTAVNLPVSLTKTVFFYFGMAGDLFWWKKMKKKFHLQNGAFYTKNGAFLHLLLVCTIFFVYIVYTLFVRVPSDCSKTPRSCSFPSWPSSERGYHGLTRTAFSTVGYDDLFLRFLCIHPVMLHICSPEKNRLQKRLLDKDSITTL